MKNGRNPRSNNSCYPLIALCSLVLTFVLFPSCQTIRNSPEPFAQAIESVPLEPGALACVLVNVPGSRPILDLISIPGLKQKEAAFVLDRINSMALAFYKEESGRRIRLAAWGNIKPSQGRLAFGMNKNWKRTRCSEGHTYWYSKADNMSVALGMKQAFLTQSPSGAFAEPCAHSSIIKLPEAGLDFMRGTVVFCWLDNPGAALERIFNEMNIPLSFPLEYVFISLFSAGDNAESGSYYKALVRIQCSGESQARAFVKIISIAAALNSNFSQSDARNQIMKLLFADAPVQDGKYISFSTPRLSAQDLAGLFNVFLL